MSDISQAALQAAISQVGKQEIPKGSNWGPDVKGYLDSVDIHCPASWCMAFVYWCFNQQQPNPLFKTGGVLMQYQQRHQNIVNTPQPGDIFIMDFGHGLGHTGIVESVGDQIVHTIEGNTNDDGSREGYEVCRRTRQISKMKGFLRF